MSVIIGSDLEAYLHRKVREQALNRIAQAEEEARQVIEKTTAEMETMRLENERRVARIIEERRRRALAQARLKAKLTFIHRREEIVERLWREAEARMRDYGDAAQRLALNERLLAEAAAQLGGGDLEIQVNAADRALFSADVLQKLIAELSPSCGVTQLTLAETPAAIWGGVIVRRANELVDNSLNERMDIAKRTLRDAVYHLLAPTKE